jgi:hypothetical protein
MASGAGTTLEGEIKEVDVKEKVPFFHETTEPVWQISDNHQQNLSFTDVRPADMTVRNLEVQVDAATSLVDTLKAKFSKLKVDDVEGGGMGSRRKIILKDVSADFPSGTLTAIIGGSGSGKVRWYLHNHLELTLSFMLRRLSLMPCLIACEDQTSPSPEAFATTDLPTSSPSRVLTSHKPMYCSHRSPSARRYSTQHLFGSHRLRPPKSVANW